MLPRTWICLDLGFNKTNCKACRKAARFCAYRTFFFVFSFAGKFTLTSAAALNSLSPSLFDIRFAADIHPLGAPAASAVLPSLFLPPTSLGFLLALRYYLSPPPPPLLPSTSFSHHPLSLSLSSVSHILLDSALGLMLMTHHPTWKHFLCGCEGAFTAVNENFKHRRPRPAPPEKKNVDGGGGKSRKSAFSPLIQILPRLMKVL